MRDLQGYKSNETSYVYQHYTIIVYIINYKYVYICVCVCALVTQNMSCVIACNRRACLIIPRLGKKSSTSDLKKIKRHFISLDQESK